MSNPNRKTGSVIFLSLFIGLIIISFMIGDMGVGGMQTTADTLAKVGDTNIRMKEFQTEYNRQLQFYSQFMGGKALTRKQIEQFKIKENTLNNLVQRLLAVELSESLGATPAGDEIKKEIKSQEYFQTNKQFDLNRYKSVLKANAYSPDEYEKLIEKDLRRKKIDGLFSGFTISSALAKELMKYRDQRREISFVRLDRAQMRENLPVSNKELKEFLAKPENKEKVKTTFTAKKPSLDQKLEVQASHILLKTAGKKEADVKKKIDDIYKKLTPKNFKSMANKHTEDSNTEPTTGIKMGGSLGWFGAGKMVAPFWDAAKALKKNGISKPVKTKFGYHIIHVTGRKEEKQAKYEDHERELALDIIRNSKGDELGKFMKEIQADAQKHLLSGNTKALDRLSKKYNLKFTKTAEVNRLTGYKGDVTLKPEQVKSIFSKSLNEVHTFEEPVGTTVLIAKKEVTVAQPEASSKLGKQEVEKTKLDIARVISRTLRQNMMNNVQKEVRVWKTNKLNQL